MSGEDLKPDPVFDKLGRFTPVGSGIDRDEWLYQAGRASVRAPRAWKWVAALLAASQSLTIAGWIGLRQSREPEPVPAATPSPAPVSPNVPYLADPDSIGSLARSFDPDTPPPLPRSDGPVPPEAVLTAGSRAEIQ
jgi:hypothetical protein